MSKFHAIYGKGGVTPEPPEPTVIAAYGVPFYPSRYAWRWDDSSDTSACTITYTFSENVNITEAAGDFTGLIGLHSKGSTFVIEKFSTFDAPSSSKNVELGGGDSIKWTIQEV